MPRTSVPPGRTPGTGGEGRDLWNLCWDSMHTAITMSKVKFIGIHEMTEIDALFTVRNRLERAAPVPFSTADFVSCQSRKRMEKRANILAFGIYSRYLLKGAMKLD